MQLQCRPLLTSPSPNHLPIVQENLCHWGEFFKADQAKKDLVTHWIKPHNSQYYFIDGIHSFDYDPETVSKENFSIITEKHTGNLFCLKIHLPEPKPLTVLS